MQKKYKLVVSDIDGTISNDRGFISPADLSAICKLNQNGIRMALCTGRAARGSVQVLRQIPFEGLHIFFDGALVCNAGLDKTIYARQIEQNVLNRVISLARVHNLTLELFSPSGYFVERDSPLASIHRGLMKLDWTVTDFSGVCAREPIIMGCLVIPTSEEQKFKPILEEYEAKSDIRFSWSLHAARPEIRMVNVVMKDVSKGAALTSLCRHLKVQLDEVITIGDGTNDISLLEMGGVAVAMQNSPAELKAVADYVTGDVDHAGFAQAMGKFLF
jgi:hypothetical protein